VAARGPLTRAAVLLAAALVGGTALVGGVSLHGAGVLAVALAGVLAGCVGAGVARDSASARPRRAVADAARRAAVGTVLVLLVLAGSVVLAGRAAPVVVVLCAGSAALARWLRRRPAGGRRPRAATAPPATTAQPAADQPAARPAVPPVTRRSPHPSERGSLPDGAPRPAIPPVATSSVEDLGREWQRTAAVLETVVDPEVRAQVVRRRGEVLDELERRDPAGFARWLASGASVDGSPARYLRGDSTAGPGPA
jgi:hypothetical protein